MPRIHLLPDQLANRIAAGEVVDRPASVVKELIENSIDAGASRINIEIEGGGTRRIIVQDNGTGMEEDDVLLCFERHGTSKIQKNDDLENISTLGFRGEAIPSIASVAKMCITSRPEYNDLGNEVSFHYGKLQKIHECGCSKGTRVEVSNLFGQTPARKKFLKTARTEISHIDETVKNYGLARPDIIFTLRIDGKTTLHFNESQDIKERLHAILRSPAKEFISIESTVSAPAKRKLSGFIVPPETHLPGNARVRHFINGRAIKDRLMHHAVIEGLRGFLLKGQTPAGYLHLHIPANEVDVNVHPAKLEVRFRNAQDIHQFIKQAMEKAMIDYQHTLRRGWTPERIQHQDAVKNTEKRDTDDSPFSTSSIEKQGIPLEKEQESGNRYAVSSRENMSSQHHKTTSFPSPTPPSTSFPSYTTREEPFHAEHAYEEISQTASRQHVEDKRSSVSFSQDQPARTHHTMRVIGQHKNLYIFCQAGDELVVIDQHAAHERLLFEKLKKHYLKDTVASQSLLFPETVELTPSQIELVEANGKILEQMGFSVSEFGGNSYVISAVPALASKLGPTEIFFDVLAGFGDQGLQHHDSKLDDILATIACKAAIKAGHSLAPEEIDGLINSMMEADLFSHCPHGRPVIKTFSGDEIKKWFSRT